MHISITVVTIFIIIHWKPKGLWQKKKKKTWKCFFFF